MKGTTLSRQSKQSFKTAPRGDVHHPSFVLRRHSTYTSRIVPRPGSKTSNERTAAFIPWMQTEAKKTQTRLDGWMVARGKNSTRESRNHSKLSHVQRLKRNLHRRRSRRLFRPFSSTRRRATLCEVDLISRCRARRVEEETIPKPQKAFILF